MTDMLKSQKPDADPVILWYRLDLRVCDHVALNAAVEAARAIIQEHVNTAAANADEIRPTVPV